jgi:heme A synthase
MDQPGPRLRRIRYLALALTALSLLIVTVSAYIRLNGAGLGCAPWPDCYGQILTGGRIRTAVERASCTASSPRWRWCLGFVLVWQCQRPLQPSRGRSVRPQPCWH